MYISDYNVEIDYYRQFFFKKFCIFENSLDIFAIFAILIQDWDQGQDKPLNSTYKYL